MISQNPTATNTLWQMHYIQEDLKGHLDNTKGAYRWHTGCQRQEGLAFMMGQKVWVFFKNPHMEKPCHKLDHQYLQQICQQMYLIACLCLSKYTQSSTSPSWNLSPDQTQSSPSLVQIQGLLSGKFIALMNSLGKLPLMYIPLNWWRPATRVPPDNLALWHSRVTPYGS